MQPYRSRDHRHLQQFRRHRVTQPARQRQEERSAARSPASVDTCQARAANVLGDLLGGDMGDGDEVSCTDDADRGTVTAVVHFEGWFGALTDYNATLTASATKEDR